MGNTIQISKVTTTTNPPILQPSSEEQFPNSIPANPPNLQKVVVLPVQVIDPENNLSSKIRILKHEKSKQPITISPKPVQKTVVLPKIEAKISHPKIPTAVSVEKNILNSERQQVVNKIVKQEMIKKSTPIGKLRSMP